MEKDNLYRKEKAFAAALKQLFEEFPIDHNDPIVMYGPAICRLYAVLCFLGLEHMTTEARNSGVPRERVDILLALLK